MQNVLKYSFIVRLINTVFAWLRKQWRNSLLIAWVTSPGREGPSAGTSVFAKLGNRLHILLAGLFYKTGLKSRFEGSIFKELFFWCLFPVALAPIIPTMAVLCLVIVGFFSLIVRFGCSREEKLAASPVNKYIILYAFLYLAATFTSVTFSGSLQTGLLTFVFMLFSVAFQTSIRTKRQAEWAVRMLVFAGVAVSMYGVYQYFFYAPDNTNGWIDSDMFSSISKRVYSTLENPNVLAEYLLLVIPFSYALTLTGKSWRQKLVFLACTAILLVCMLLTISRGGWVGLIIATALFLILLDSRLILVGIVGLVALYFVLPDVFVERLNSIGNMTDSSTSYRVSIWLGTLSMLHDYWLSGIGPGTAAFNMVYPAYSFNTITAPHSHNLFLQIVCDCGIVGILVFLGIILSYFRSVGRALFAEKDRKTRQYLIAAISAVSGFLVQSMTDYSFYNYRVMLMFWIVLGLGVALTRMPHMEEGKSIWSKS